MLYIVNNVIVVFPFNSINLGNVIVVFPDVQHQCEQCHGEHNDDIAHIDAMHWGTQRWPCWRPLGNTTMTLLALMIYISRTQLCHFSIWCTLGSTIMTLLALVWEHNYDIAHLYSAHWETLWHRSYGSVHWGMQLWHWWKWWFTLAHCGLVTPYGVKDLGQHWLR